MQTCSLDNNRTHVLLTDQSYQYFPKHCHETYSVAILTDGGKDFSTSRGKCTLDNTKVVTLNPCEIHSGKSLTEDGWSQLVILFEGESARDFAEENGIKRKELTFSAPVREDVKNRAELIRQIMLTSEAETEMELEHCHQMIMSLLLSFETSSHSKTYANTHAIRRTISMMHERPDDKLSLDTLAGEAKMSKFHYLRSFKSQAGMTPHAYLNMVRVEKARRQILTSASPIAEIAVECGFTDQAHFTRAYRRIYGTTPGTIIRK